MRNRQHLDGGAFSFEVWRNKFQLQAKMFKYTFIFFFIVHVLFVAFLTFEFSGPGVYTLSANELLKLLGRNTLITSPLWIIFILINWHFAKSDKELMEERLKRGARLVEAEEYMKMAKGEELDLPVGEVKMPKSAETKHVFIVGRPGSGKTLIIRRVIERLRERGEKMIIYDFKGDFICKFYDPKKDYIFNPVDKRCVRWTLFNDVNTEPDLDLICASMIQENQKEPFWSLSARDILHDILLYVYRSSEPTNKKLFEIASLPPEELTLYLSMDPKLTRHRKYLEKVSENKTALSILATLQAYIKPLEFLQYIDGDFSFKKWMEGDSDSVLFITSYADMRETLKPILTVAVDILATKLLSMRDDLKRRRFFILDEFGTLQKLYQIVDLLTNSRSKGGSVWIGIQDFGQIDRIYSKEDRSTVVNACGNMIILGVSDPDTAEFLSKKAGEKEVEVVEPSITVGTTDIRDSFSLAWRDKKEQLILPIEFIQLEDRKGFVKFVGYPYTKIEVPIIVYKDTTPAIELAPYVFLKEEEQEELSEAEKDLAQILYEAYIQLYESEKQQIKEEKEKRKQRKKQEKENYKRAEKLRKKEVILKLMSTYNLTNNFQ